ncbi:MAG TPA: peptide-methionine (R)-S-oxide reductase MsrB [Chitinophagaceae bacterium]|nr:peptide-methionine (R)-S-oxide reductase MsrB [Chitinophagaceae bacterium]
MKLRNLLFLIIPVVFQQCADSQNKTMEHQKNPYYSRTDTTKLHVPLVEWKKILPPDVYHIAFEKGTETAFTGKYWNYTGIGTYYCAVCGNELFRSDAKFASTCGWPSFFEPVRKNSVIYKPDPSFGMDRTEVECGRCGAHLGHVFNDGPKPTGLRYCMNSIVLDFVPDGSLHASR